MEGIKDILTAQIEAHSDADSRSLNQILGKIYKGIATDEDRQYYIDHYMTDEEKKIGKPYFEMNEREKKQYQVMCYNNQPGELDGYDCPKCKNRGDFLYINEQGYEVYTNCSCKKVRNTIRKMERSGLGNLLSLYTFDKYECTDEWQQNTFIRAKTFVASDRNWFCMLGQSGAGKSHICTAISRELLKQGMDLKYMMWLDDSTALKQAITDGEKYKEMIDEYKDVQVLYIDDFFKSDNETKPSPADIKLANEILNYRYNKARMDKSKRWITIISSERTLEQLLAYDQALAGRIVEMSKPDNLIMLEGIEKNYRLR